MFQEFPTASSYYRGSDLLRLENCKVWAGILQMTSVVSGLGFGGTKGLRDRFRFGSPASVVWPVSYQTHTGHRADGKVSKHGQCLMSTETIAY